MIRTQFNPLRPLLLSPADDNGQENSTATPAPADTETPPAPTETPTTPEDKGNPELNDEPNPFNFDIDDVPEGEADPAEGSDDPAEDDTEYSLEIDEDLGVTDSALDIMTTQAKALGIDKSQAGKFISSVLKDIATAEQQAQKESNEALKQEWGAHYNTNINNVKRFAGQLAQKSGLSTQDLAPLMSPKGFKLLHAMSKGVGESKIVTPKPAQALDPETEINAILNDPDHKYHKALTNPADPLFKEATEYYQNLYIKK